VNSGLILRGAQPTEIGIRELAAAHVKTVLNLREEKDLIRTEAAIVEAAGMNFISVPLSGFWSPKDKDIALVESLLNRPDLQPIFIHCKLGEDRSGLVVGLYRVFTQHVEPRAAYEEMKHYGFHHALVFLKHYFDEKTGL
jgi:tyrosine-protein phosphatase SIW14